MCREQARERGEAARGPPRSISVSCRAAAWASNLCFCYQAPLGQPWFAVRAGEQVRVMTPPALAMVNVSPVGSAVATTV